MLIFRSIGLPVVVEYDYSTSSGILSVLYK